MTKAEMLEIIMEDVYHGEDCEKGAIYPMRWGRVNSEIVNKTINDFEEAFKDMSFEDRSILYCFWDFISMLMDCRPQTEKDKKAIEDAIDAIDTMVSKGSNQEH